MHKTTVHIQHVMDVFDLKVMSETVASALQMIDEENTGATRLFIRMVDMCFYALNVKSTLEGKLKRKEFQLPYTDPLDSRFQVRTFILHWYSYIQ